LNRKIGETIMKALLKSLVALCIAMAGALAVHAHEPQKGPNGGLRVDAGKYHAELVADGSPNVTLFLTDADYKPVPAMGFKANAIFVIEGKPQRFALEPLGEGKLAGAAPVPVPGGVKGAIQLAGPQGETAQAKY
jgi:hypothetical protein